MNTVNRMTGRGLMVQSLILSGIMTVTVTPQVMQSVFAAEAAKSTTKSPPEESKAPSNYLHDGEKTVNPWSCGPSQLDRDRTALSAANEGIRRDPTDPWNFIGRADAYLHLMKSKEALSDANAALGLKPKDTGALRAAYCNRGEALLQLKQYKAALDDLIKACDLGDRDAEAFYFRGMAREKLGQLPQAIKDYEIAHSLGFSPKMLEVDYSEYMNKLQRRIKSNWHPPKGKETKRAVVVFKVARDGTVPILKIYKPSGVADVDAAAISAVKAAAPFEPLPKGAPNDVDVEFAFDYNVHTGGVVSFLARVTEKWDNAEADALRKLTNARNGKDETAIVNAELKLAKIYTDRGRYPQAIELYQNTLRVLERKPEQQLVYGKSFGRLAMVYSLQGKNAEAETEFKKSLEIVDKGFGTAEAPSDAEVAEILQEYAKVLYKTKKIDEANKIYARLKR